MKDYHNNENITFMFKEDKKGRYSRRKSNFYDSSWIKKIFQYSLIPSKMALKNKCPV